jgi:hypothetical protein
MKMKVEFPADWSAELQNAIKGMATVTLAAFMIAGAALFISLIALGKSGQSHAN